MFATPEGGRSNTLLHQPRPSTPPFATSESAARDEATFAGMEKRLMTVNMERERVRGCWILWGGGGGGGVGCGGGGGGGSPGGLLREVDDAVLPQLEHDLQRLGPRSGRTIAARREKADAEARLAKLQHEASQLRLKLRAMKQ